MRRLYHISQVCKEPSRLNQTRPEREALIHLRRRHFSSASIRKDHKSLLKGRSSSLKWQEMQMSEGIREQY